MAGIVLRANSFKTLPTGVSGPSWTSVGGGSVATNIGDGNDATGIYADESTAAVGAWHFADATLQSDTIINRIQLIVRMKFDHVIPSDGNYGSGPIYFNLYDNVISNISALGSGDTRAFEALEYTQKTVLDVTTKTNGKAFTLTDINQMYLLIQKNNQYGVKITISDVWAVINYTQPPRLTASGNNIVVTDTATPAFPYAFTSADGSYLGAWQARLFEYGETLKPNFDWQTTPALWDSGVVNVAATSSVLSFTPKPTVAMDNGHKYVMYARALPKDSPLAWSPVVVNARIIDVRTPFIPRLTITEDEVNKRFQLLISREDNLFSEDQSIFTGGLGGWALLSGGASVSATTGSTGADGSVKSLMYVSYTGSSNYSVACGAPGTPYANNGATAAFNAVANEWHTFAFSVWAIGTSGVEFRNVIPEIHWYNASNTLISTATGSIFRTVGSQWTMCSVTAKAPSSATKCAIVIKFTGQNGSGEFHLFDQMDFHVGGANLLKNPIFARDVDGDNIPDSWSYFSSGDGNAATYAYEKTDFSKIYVGKLSYKFTKANGGNTNDGLKQTVYCAKGSINTFTAWMIADYAATIYVYVDNWTPLTQQVTLTPGVMTAVTVTGTMSASVQTTTVYAGIKNPSGGSVWIGAGQLEPKPVNNSVSIGTIPSTIGKSRLNQFTQGGVSSVKTEIQSSSDGGVTWSGIYKQDSSQTPYDSDFSMTQNSTITLSDYMEPLGKDILFRVRHVYVSVDVNDSSSVLQRASQWSVITKGNLDKLIRGAILKSVTDPSLNVIAANAVGKIDKVIQKNRRVVMPLNSKQPIVISGNRRSASLPFAFYCKTRAVVEAIEALLDQDDTLYLQLPKGEWFVNLSGDYTESEFLSSSSNEQDDTVISGTFQTVREPLK